MRALNRLLALGLAAAAPGLAQATVLTFHQTFGNGGIAGYGDRVQGPAQDGATYGDAGGWTPNVTLDFDTAPWGLASLWQSGYAGNNGQPGLVWALGHGAFNVPLHLDFRPDDGHSVRIESFQIATWSNGAYRTQIRIWDDGGSFDAPNLLAHESFLAPNQIYDFSGLGQQATQGTVHFYLSNLGSTGIDNLQFSQSLTVPEPSSYALMALGLAGIAGVARRRRRAA